ncbi:MAG: hypothetical protein LBG44_08145 [Gemmatimonadota bacterium]|nr:hypothetical protein [Gemmatimonadota bacterium]
MTAIAELREMIGKRFPNSVPLPARTVPQVATGVPALDRVLPGGGFPRGQLTVWMAGAGGAAVMRSACREAVRRGERAAWVESVGKVMPDVSWPGVVVAHPRSEEEALECVEALLGSGGFAIVAYAGGVGSSTARLRLCRAAREGGAAFVEVSDNPHMAAVKIRAPVSPEQFQWSCNALGEPILVGRISLHVTVEAAGWNRKADVVLKVMSHEHSLFPDPGLADRRGVGRSRATIRQNDTEVEEEIRTDIRPEIGQGNRTDFQAGSRTGRETKRPADLPASDGGAEGRPGEGGIDMGGWTGNGGGGPRTEVVYAAGGVRTGGSPGGDIRKAGCGRSGGPHREGASHHRALG